MKKTINQKYSKTRNNLHLKRHTQMLDQSEFILILDRVFAI